MYRALYREYRPEVFEEMLGQQHIVKILKNQIDTGSVSHAYLFCGTRGTGKTTTARLLAKAINCLSEEKKPCAQCDNCKMIKSGNFIDLIEIDAASNNGINDIRELRESVNFPPAVGEKKVYIIDEVHMLSKEAFNGFLKTLEEPPENVVFILATTEPQKLPQTILSRCIRMDFRRVNEDEIIDRMFNICVDRGVEVSESTLRLVAANADGSVRDGLTLLDQCISGRNGKIEREEVLDALGVVGEEIYIELTNAIISKNVTESILVLNKVFASGKDARQILVGLINHYRNLLLTKYVKKPEDMLNMSMENIKRVNQQSELMDLEDINEAIIVLSKTGGDIIYSTQGRILLELAIIKITSGFQRQQKVKEKVTIEQKIESEISKEVEIEKTETNNFENQGALANNSNMNEVWDEVCQLAAIRKPKMMVIRKCTFPRELSAGELVVGVTNDTAKMMIDNEKSMLIEIIEELTGSKKHITIAGEKANDMDNDNLEETANIAENYLGINVEIK